MLHLALLPYVCVSYMIGILAFGIWRFSIWHVGVRMVPFCKLDSGPGYWLLDAGRTRPIGRHRAPCCLTLPPWPLVPSCPRRWSPVVPSTCLFGVTCQYNMAFDIFAQNHHNSTLLAATKLILCIQRFFRHAEIDFSTPEAPNLSK